MAAGGLVPDFADALISQGRDQVWVHEFAPAVWVSASGGGGWTGYEMTSISTGTAPGGRRDGSVSRSWNRDISKADSSLLSCFSSSAVRWNRCWLSPAAL